MLYIVQRCNPWTGVKGGNDTTDKVFLLSLEALVGYFGDSGQLNKRPKINVPGRKLDGFQINDEFNSNRMAKGYSWWLRTPAGRNDSVIRVDGDGKVIVDCGSATGKVSNTDGVRSALRINIYHE